MNRDGGRRRTGGWPVGRRKRPGPWRGLVPKEMGDDGTAAGPARIERLLREADGWPLVIGHRAAVEERRGSGS